jgi:hypothetical protein
MANEDTWGTINPGTITGFGGGGVDSGSGGLLSGLSGSVGTRGSIHPPLYSPDNPVFWLAVVLALAGGALAVSTHARLGPFKASAAV